MPATITRNFTNNDKFVWLVTLVYYINMFLSFGRSNAALLIICSILVLVTTNYKFEFKLYHLFVFQFCLFCYATAFWAMGYAYAIDKGNTIFFIFLSMSVFYSYYEDLPKCGVDILLHIMLYGAYIIVLYSIFFIGVSKLASMSEDAERVSAGTNANTMGLVAATAIVINTYYYLSGKHRKLMLMAIPCIYLIAGSQSRKALFMMVAGVVLLYFLKNLRGKKDNLLPIMKFVFFMGVIIGIFIFLSQTDLFSGAVRRMEGFINSVTGEGEVDSSTSKREFMRKIGWIQFSRTPLLGIGMGCARLLTQKAMDIDGYLHCNYAELAADGGIVGLISYYSMYIYVLVKEIKYFKVDNLAILFLALIILKFFTDWGMVSYYSKGVYFSFMVYFLHIQWCKRQYPHLNKKRRAT